MADANDAKSRAVFSKAAREAFEVADQPMQALDRETGTSLAFRAEAPTGGCLTLQGRHIPHGILVVGCHFDDADRVAAILLDGVRFQSLTP